MPMDLLAGSTPSRPPMKLTIPTAENLAAAKSGKPDGQPKDLLAQETKEPVFQPVKDLLAYTSENFKAGKDAATAPAFRNNPKEPGPELLQRIGDAGGRAMGAMGMATAPLGAVGHAAISKPLERATGIPAEYTDLLRMFAPAGAGAVTGAAGKLAKAVPAIGKAVTAVKDSPIAQTISKGTQLVLSPTTMSKEAGQAEGIVRENRGQAELSTEQAKAKLEPDYHYLSTLPPDQQLNFISRVENFSKGAPLADARMEKAAENLRGIYHTVRNDLETDDNFDKMGFVQDYFPHMWQDPKKAQEFIQGWSKTGSARNTKARSIPTIEDGIKAGLVPKSTNPAELTMQYIGNMYNYKSLKGIQSGMSAQGIRKYYPQGRQPAGWVELKGPGNRNLVQTKSGIVDQVAYAPEDAARVYNRNYSPGFTGPFGSIVQGIRKVVNNSTQLALGLSAYHYRLLANESTAAALSKGTAKGVAEATPYLGAMKHVSKGKEIEEQAMAGKGRLDQKIIDLIARGGGRLKGVDRSMDMSAQGDYWRAWRDGSLKASAKADAMNLKAGGPLKVIMKTIGSVSQPLFMKTIPRIKNAVNYEAISEWVKAHPAASDEEILKATRDIIDSTDNRFGELIQDNVFWDKRLKETAQLMLLSVGWSMGTARETVGGAKDLANFIEGKGELTQRARYVLTAPIAHMLHATVYQALRTGGSPQELQDLVYPKTGGTSPYDNMPERATQPGQMNDVIRYTKHPIEELQGKMAPLWKTVWQMANNKDWRDDPIAYQYQKNAPGWFRGYVSELAGLSPISVRGAMTPTMKGSAIGPVGRLMGDRPAGMAAEDPVGFANMEKSLQQKAEKKGMRHLQTEKAREVK